MRNNELNIRGLRDWNWITISQCFFFFSTLIFKDSSDPRPPLPSEMRVYSYHFVYIKWSISPMYCIIKTHRQKAWDDGVVPSENAQTWYLKSYYNLDLSVSLSVYYLLRRLWTDRDQTRQEHAGWSSYYNMTISLYVWESRWEPHWQGASIVQCSIDPATSKHFAWSAMSWNKGQCSNLLANVFTAFGHCEWQLTGCSNNPFDIHDSAQTTLQF